MSITKKSLLAAKPPSLKPRKVRKPPVTVSHTQNGTSSAPLSKAAAERLKQQERREAKAEPQPFWVPHSPVVRHASEAMAKLIASSETKRSGATIKTLCLAGHVTAKKATFALTVQTLRYLPVLQQVVEAVHLLEKHPKLTPPVAFVLCYEVLFGQSFKPMGPAERCMYNAKAALREQLQLLVTKSKVKSVEDLLPATLKKEATSRPRSVRVNTCLMTVAEAKAWLASPPEEHSAFVVEEQAVQSDELLPDVLVLPAGTNMHDHPLVLEHKLIPQSRSSCMAAHAVDPQRGEHVVDCCAAPGNKTSHLAALLGGSGRVDAFEKNEKRAGHLSRNIEACCASNVTVHQGDFLKVDTSAQEWAGVSAVLLDPSCSGSGTTHNRMDFLLPSTWQTGDAETQAAAAEATTERIEKLAEFQEAALRHAFTFPSLQRLVYSTCSVHRRENEDVIAAVLPDAHSQGFRLKDPFPSWHRRGLPVVAGAEKLVRVDPEDDQTDGFFIAVFHKHSSSSLSHRRPSAGKKDAPLSLGKPKKVGKGVTTSVAAARAGANLANKDSKNNGKRRKRVND